MPTKAYWLTETLLVNVSLRRYVGSEIAICQGPSKYHHAKVFIERRTAKLGPIDSDDGRHHVFECSVHQDEYDGDPRWPIKCEYCGYLFTDADERQVFEDHLWMRADTRELMTLHEAPPGAVWNAWWMHRFRKMPDGLSLMAKCPDGCDWWIDGRARNCGSPDDDVHRCWVRHGVPPMLTVDKNGPTCSAGAGSIDTGSWHGFLQQGMFNP